MAIYTPFLVFYYLAVMATMMLAVGQARAGENQLIHGIWDWPDTGCSGNPEGDYDEGAFVGRLALFDGRLVAAGGFLYAGGLPAKCLAMWNGNQWTTLGTTFPNSTVQAVLPVDDTLFIGGVFNKIGDLSAKGVAKWDGEAWSALGNGPGIVVSALQAWDDGSGSILFAGGTNTYRWNGSTWTLVGSGALVFDLFDDGSGTALYAGRTNGGGIVKWDGVAWSLVGGGITGFCQVRALEVFDDGTGPALYIGGIFEQVGGVPAVDIARWNGQDWSAVGNPGLDPVLDTINELKVLDLGNGPRLFAVGNEQVMSWDGQHWTRYLPDIGNMYTVEVFNGPQGPMLHLGGAVALGNDPDDLHTNIARFTASFACGDFNGDGVTDQLDLGILLAAYDCVGLDCQADADGDGDVDQSDLGILLAHFGQTCG